MQQNTISNNTFTSSVKDISQGNIEYGMTSAQFYCSLACLTLVLVVSIVMISRLMQTAILRVNYISPKILQKLKEEILEELK